MSTVSPFLEHGDRSTGHPDLEPQERGALPHPMGHDPGSSNPEAAGRDRPHLCKLLAPEQRQPGAHAAACAHLSAESLLPLPVEQRVEAWKRHRHLGRELPQGKEHSVFDLGRGDKLWT